MLYEGLVRMAPTTGASVGRAAAVAESHGAVEGWPFLDQIPAGAMPDIMHVLRVQARSERVYHALTAADDLRGWRTRDAVLDARIGGRGEFGFHGRRFVVTVQLDELEPPTRAGWKVLTAPGWGPAITFDLREEGGGTIVTFARRGFRDTNAGYASATTRWGACLISLKQLLETGTGSPHPQDIFTLPSLAQLRRRHPHAVTDGDTVLAAVDVAASPERAFAALTSDEMERWWGVAGGYRMTAWSADLRRGAGGV